MDSASLITGLISGAAAGLAIGYLLQKNRGQSLLNLSQQQLAASDATYNALLAEHNRLRGELNAALEENRSMTADISRIQAELKATENKLTERLQDLENVRKQMREEFENMATNAVLKQSSQLQQQNKETLDAILSPVKEKISSFEKKVEDSQKSTLEQSTQLKEQLKQLHELNKTLSDDAQNLTKALKGESKTRGNWGENILLTILEKAGLQKGIHYNIQQSTPTEDGRRLIPDVVINLPDSKNLVIDSKVNLVDYEKYSAEEDSTLRERHLQNHLKGIKGHMKELKEKDYHKLYGINSPDFVLMFMPIEPAFNIAVQQDLNLYAEGFEQGVILITNSTLLATLKTVESLWKQENRNRNALEIARQAGDLYDKFKNFADEMVKLGTQMDTAKNTYSEAMKKLSTGKGNLVSRAEKMKKLGIDTNKQIDPRLLERALDSDEQEDSE